MFQRWFSIYHKYSTLQTVKLFQANFCFVSGIPGRQVSVILVQLCTNQNGPSSRQKARLGAKFVYGEGLQNTTGNIILEEKNI